MKHQDRSSTANLTRLLTDIIRYSPSERCMPCSRLRCRLPRRRALLHTMYMFISTYSASFTSWTSREEDDDASPPIAASIIITIMLPRLSILVIISTAASAQLSPQQSRRCSTTGSHLHNKRLRLRRLLADHSSTTFTSNLRK